MTEFSHKELVLQMTAAAVDSVRDKLEDALEDNVGYVPHLEHFQALGIAYYWYMIWLHQAGVPEEEVDMWNKWAGSAAMTWHADVMQRTGAPFSYLTSDADDDDDDDDDEGGGYTAIVVPHGGKGPSKH